ncbi:mannose-1-phosphate guanylyltransferase [Candidatus Roizmanbacteria bacterium]|nr:mannose-1-phosphate guanylyltransferase [Candidatus Roizmanbacteria bacterium]
MNIVVFAGGVGSRLWPLSRKNTPKQFEKVLGEKSTLQLAVDRLQPDFAWENIYVSTGMSYLDIVRSQLPELPGDNIIGEPVMRDVGPAVGLMTGILAKIAPNTPMAILWSDHLVKKEEHFRKILQTAGEVVKKEKNKIVFVGQKPRFASENLGWVNYGDQVFQEDGISFYAFKGCKYQPDTETAQKYLESGHHAWNLGYFVTTPQFLWQQFKKLAPNVYQSLEKIVDTWGTDQFQAKLKEIYPTVEKIHFDNVILEKLDLSDAYVISENIEWSDIGAWEALKEALEKHEEDNVIKGNAIVQDSKDSLIFNFTKQMVVGIDLDDMVIVNTNDVILVCPKKSVPKIKKVVQSLQGTSNEHLV